MPKDFYSILRVDRSPRRVTPPSNLPRGMTLFLFSLVVVGQSPY